jgi:hypothetical protein
MFMNPSADGSLRVPVSLGHTKVDENRVCCHLRLKLVLSLPKRGRPGQFSQAWMLIGWQE